MVLNHAKRLKEVLLNEGVSSMMKYDSRIFSKKYPEFSSLISEMHQKGKCFAELATNMVAYWRERKTSEEVFQKPIWKQIDYRIGYFSSYISGALIGAIEFASKRK